MKIFFLHIVLLMGIPVSYAQSSCSIKKAYAWYNVSMPGVQMADENGNPIPPKANITRFIYVEYSGTKLPEIKSVTYNDTALGFSVEKVKEKAVSIGDKRLNPGKAITVKKGNSFLKINLYPFEGKTMPDADCKKITINCKIAGRPCRFTVFNETAFATLPRY